LFKTDDRLEKGSALGGGFGTFQENKPPPTVHDDWPHLTNKIVHWLISARRLILARKRCFCRMRVCPWRSMDIRWASRHHLPFLPLHAQIQLSGLGPQTLHFLFPQPLIRLSPFPVIRPLLLLQSFPRRSKIQRVGAETDHGAMAGSAHIVIPVRHPWPRWGLGLLQRSSSPPTPSQTLCSVSFLRAVFL
jgi:hypothetical protein